MRSIPLLKLTSLDLQKSFSEHLPVIKILVPALIILAAPAFAAGKKPVHSFSKAKFTDQFWSEGAATADFDRDGHIDIAYGPYWFAGPEFIRKSEYRPANKTFIRKRGDGSPETIPGFEGALGTNNAYSDCFLMFTHDFNRDRWPDILVIDTPGLAATWYENPGKKAGPWRSHVALAVVDNESPGFTDITGDGKPEIVCCSGGYIGFAEADWKKPEAPWTFRPVSPKGTYHKYTHGLGVGDVNGDGRPDLLEKDGWWEQPKKLREGELWIKHSHNFGQGGAQMFAYDVNGDGLNDVISSLEAHGYGVAWFEQIRSGGQTEFRQHLIIGREPKENRFGVAFSQPHALVLVDVDGDGLKDIVTGKRFWAHGAQGDPEPNAPAVLYWFQLQRGGERNVEFIPHLVDNDSGVGTQVTAARVSNKKNPDIIVGNKKGLFLFRHELKNIPLAEWNVAQPKPIYR